MPDPAHDRIRIEPTGGRVRIVFGDLVVAETTRALTLHETGRPPVQYVPRADVNMALLEATPRVTQCPWKGAASYFSIAGADPRGVNGLWTYETPLPAAAAIAGHIAVYADRFTIEILPD
jgi:uncharacterized protein (DUF427 family)